MAISALESISPFVPLKSMDTFDRYIKWKLQIFDSIASFNTAADTANPHPENDLERNETLDVNIESNASLTASSLYFY